jgi:hypothetical protein
MLLDGRVSGPDQRRVLEEMRDVLGRVNQLILEASQLAHWTERTSEDLVGRADGHSVVEAAFADVRRTQTVETHNEVARGAATILTIDAEALAAAVAALLGATARERPGQSTKIMATLAAPPPRIELLAGGPDTLSRLGGGPHVPAATAISMERGGLGLALVNAALILDTHGGVAWTIEDQRGACGIRLPVEV